MEVYIIIAIAIIIFIIIKLLNDKKRNYEKLVKQIKERYGNLPDREYTYEEFENISNYYKKHANKDNNVDDITWNDLNMDSVFIMLNNTLSSPGQEYLYYLLRTPVFDEQELKERNRLAEFFDKNETIREKFMIIFAKLGRTRRYSLTEYIYTLADLEERSSLKNILLALSCLLSIGLIVIKPGIGVVALCVSISASIIYYMLLKNEIDPYITTVSFIIKLLQCVDEIEKIECDELKDYIDSLKEAKSKINKIRKNSFLLTSGSNLIGGGPETLLLDYVRMVFHVDIIKFNSMLKQVKHNLSDIELLISRIGYLESMIAIASFRKYVNYYTIPEFVDDGHAFLKAIDVYHPLIKNPVSNSIEVSNGVLITGSNASGKSTFLKTIAINAILSQTIYTALANEYKTVMFSIYTSMALNDSLENNESYYIVEIKSLKRIIDKHDKGYILCFVDEVLRGTNTVERIAASAQILKSLAKDNVMCFAATHDIELTYLLEDYYNNYHFEEEIIGNDIRFDYKLKCGRSLTKNAIKLLNIIGYSDDIINDANNSAKHFVETGKWEL